LFHRDESLFDRKLRKYLSVLAGEASSALSLRLGAPACLDCRISQIPAAELVVDYFRWRNEDAHRNALNAHCYWTLRRTGASVKQATERLLRLSVSDKNELLFQHGVNFSKLPQWQRRGIGAYWERVEKAAVNRKTGKAVTAVRRRLKVDFELPMKEAYERFLKEIVDASRGDR
jgi:tRNA(His) 5'-end guanylyltransferase